MLPSIPDMIRRPGVYRKLFIYIGMAIFTIANAFFDMNLDEEVYTKQMQALFDSIQMALTIVAGWGIWKFQNDSYEDPKP